MFSCFSSSLVADNCSIFSLSRSLVNNNSVICRLRRCSDCLCLENTQHRSMTDIIRATIANAVNHAMVVDSVLNEALEAAHRSAGFRAKKITCSPCIVTLSVIISHLNNFIGSKLEVLWDFFVNLQLFFVLSKSTQTLPQNNPQVKKLKVLHGCTSWY